MEKQDMSTLKIYGKDNCYWCKQAKELAERYEFDYEYIDVGLTEGLKELKENVPDARLVPQIFWNGEHLGGYSEFADTVESTIGGFGEQLF